MHKTYDIYKMYLRPLHMFQQKSCDVHGFLTQNYKNVLHPCLRYCYTLKIAEHTYVIVMVRVYSGLLRCSIYLQLLLAPEAQCFIVLNSKSCTFTSLYNDNDIYMPCKKFLMCNRTVNVDVKRSCSALLKAPVKMTTLFLKRM
jgi:hypothetical protein